jgi:hypothetical protein
MKSGPIGASATETVIDFGERHAEVTAAKAVYAAAVANYRLTVLNAFADVENDLSGLRILGDKRNPWMWRSTTPFEAPTLPWRNSKPVRSITPRWPWRRRLSWPTSKRS